MASIKRGVPFNNEKVIFTKNLKASKYDNTNVTQSNKIKRVKMQNRLARLAEPPKHRLITLYNDFNNLLTKKQIEIIEEKIGPANKVNG